MTDQEVIAIVRRRLVGIEHELTVDPPSTAKQFAVAMIELAREYIRQVPDDPDHTDAAAAPAAALDEALTRLQSDHPHRRSAAPPHAR